MRGVPKTLAMALVALLLVAALAGCGGDDDSSSTAAEAGGQGSTRSGGGPSQTGEAKDGDNQGKSGSADGEEQSGSSSGSSSDFVPKSHTDSGGGSQQYRVKGGDNSVQEFGEEADSSELDAAAATLHNFLDARAQGNWTAACEYMSKGMVESIEKLAAQAKEPEDTSCGGILEKVTNPAAKQSLQEEAAQADVGSLRIEDGNAFVIYTAINGTVIAMPMANEDGDWKVASLAGTPLS